MDLPSYEPKLSVPHQSDIEAVVASEFAALEAGTLDKAATAAAVPNTATTAQLVAIANAINTKGKAVGKCVFNTTTGLPVWALGATAAGVWVAADGTTAHTPA